MLAAHRSRRRVALAVAAVLAIAPAACGGDEASDDLSTTTSAAQDTASSSSSTSTAADDTKATTPPDDTTGSVPPDDTTGTVAPDDTTSDTTDDGGTGSVELLDPGAEDGRIQLPGMAKVGQTGSGAATIGAGVSMSGAISQDGAVSLVLRYEAEIVEADDSGYVAETEITDTELLDGPSDIDLSALEAVIGVRYRQTFSADGKAGEIEVANEDELTPEQLTAFEQFGSGLSSAAAVAYPSEPIGVGARWVSQAPVQSEGFELDVNYQYELTEVDGSDYVVEITYDEEIDETIAQGEATGTVSGAGSLRGSADNPLLTTTELTQDIAMSLEDDSGQALDMEINLEILLENE